MGTTSDVAGATAGNDVVVAAEAVVEGEDVHEDAADVVVAVVADVGVGADAIDAGAEAEVDVGVGAYVAVVAVVGVRVGEEVAHDELDERADAGAAPVDVASTSAPIVAASGWAAAGYCYLIGAAVARKKNSMDPGLQIDCCSRDLGSRTHLQLVLAVVSFVASAVVVVEPSAAVVAYLYPCVSLSYEVAGHPSIPVVADSQVDPKLGPIAVP